MNRSRNSSGSPRPFERRPPTYRASLKFKNSQELDHWLSSQDATDYTYVRSPTYSPQPEESEDSDCPVPIMSRRASGKYTPTLSGMKEEGGTPRKRRTPARGQQQHSGAGMTTRSKSRLRSGNLRQNESMHHQGSSTPQSQTGRRSRTYEVRTSSAYESQHSTPSPVTALHHLYGLDHSGENLNDITPLPGSIRNEVTGSPTVNSRHTGRHNSGQSRNEVTVSHTVNSRHTRTDNSVHLHEEYSAALSEDYSDTDDSTDVHNSMSETLPTVLTQIKTIFKFLYVFTVALITRVVLPGLQKIWKRLWKLGVMVFVLNKAADFRVYRYIRDGFVYAVNAVSNSTVVSRSASWRRRFLWRSEGEDEMEDTISQASEDDEMEEDVDLETTTTVIRTVIERKRTKAGALALPCPYFCLPLLLLLLLGTTAFYIYPTSEVTQPLPLGNATSNATEDKLANVVNLTSQHQDLHLHSTLIREELERVGRDVMLSEETVKNDELHTLLPAARCQNCVPRDELQKMVNAAVKQEINILQDKLTLYNSHHLEEVERLKLDYEKRIGDLQNEVNVLNHFSKDSSEHVLVDIRTIENDLAVLRNDMRTFVFVAPDGEGKTTNIREYTTGNFQRLKIDLDNMDGRLENLEGDLRTFGSRLSTQGSQFEHRTVRLSDALDETGEQRTAIMSNVSKLAASVGALRDNITRLQRDVAALQDSGAYGGKRISDVIGRINDLEIEVSDIKGDVQGLNSESRTLSAKVEASLQVDEVRALNTAFNGLKEEVRELHVDVAQVLKNNDVIKREDQQAVVRKIFSELTTDVQRAVDETDSFKSEMTSFRDTDRFRHMSAEQLAIWERLVLQQGSVAAAASSLKTLVAGLKVSQDDVVNLVYAFTRLSELERQLVNFRTDLRNFHHDPVANNGWFSAETKHANQVILNQINTLDSEITSMKSAFRNSHFSERGDDVVWDGDVDILRDRYANLQIKSEEFERNLESLQMDLRVYIKKLVSEGSDAVNSEAVEEVARYQSYVSRFETELLAVRADMDLDVSRSQGIPTGAEWARDLEAQIRALQEDVLDIRYSNINVEKLKSDIEKMESAVVALKPGLLALQQTQTFGVTFPLQQIGELSADFVFLNARVSSLKGLVGRMRSEAQRSEVIRNMNKLQSDITRFKVDLRHTELAAIAESESHHAALATEAIGINSLLQEELDTVRNEIRNLLLHHDSTAVRERMARLQSVLDSLRQDWNRDQEKFQLIRSRIKGDEKEMMEKLRGDLNAIKLGIEELSPELKKNSFENSDDLYSSVHSAVVSLQAEVDEIKQMQGKVDSAPDASDVISSIKASISQLQSESGKVDFQAIPTDVVNLKEDVKHLKEAAVLGEHVQQTLAVLLKKVETVESETVATLQRKLESVESEIARLHRLHSDQPWTNMQDSIGDLQVEVRMLKLHAQSLVSGKTDLQAIQTDVVNLKKDLASLRVAVVSGEHAQQTVATLLARLESVESEILRLDVLYSDSSTTNTPDAISDLQASVQTLKLHMNQLRENVHSLRLSVSEQTTHRSHATVLAVGDVAGLEAVLAEIKSDLSFLSGEKYAAVHKDYESVAGRVSQVEMELGALKEEMASQGSDSSADFATLSGRFQNLQSDLKSMRIDVDTLTAILAREDDDFAEGLRYRKASTSRTETINLRSEDVTVDADDTEYINIIYNGTPMEINREALLGLASGWSAAGDGSGKFAEDLKRLRVDVDNLTSEHLRLLSELHRCCRNESFFKLLIRDNVVDILNQVMQEDSDGVIAAWLHGQFISKEQYEKDFKDIHIRLKELLLIRSGYAYNAVNIGDIQSTYSSGSDGGGAVTGALTEQRIRDIINEALFLFSADKTGLVDYALESAGGSVINTRCSETHESKTALLSIFGIPLWYAANSPRTAIQPDIQPGNCWAFKGTTGYLVIQLSGPVKPTSFSMEHIPKSLSPNGKIESAPREFSVWGLEDEFQKEGKHLGSFEYKEDGAPLQFFIVADPEPGVFPIVELKIHSNHGSLDFTCLYRFRVHGVLHKG